MAQFSFIKVRTCTEFPEFFSIFYTNSFAHSDKHFIVTGTPSFEILYNSDKDGENHVFPFSALPIGKGLCLGYSCLLFIYFEFYVAFNTV